MHNSAPRPKHQKLPNWTLAVGDTVYHADYGRGEVKKQIQAGYQLLVEFVGDVARRRWVIVRELASSLINPSRKADVSVEQDVPQAVSSKSAEHESASDMEEMLRESDSTKGVALDQAVATYAKPDCISCEKPTVVIQEMLFKEIKRLRTIDFIHMLNALCRRECLWRQYHPFEGWGQATIAGMLSKNGKHYWMKGYEIFAASDGCPSRDQSWEETDKTDEDAEQTDSRQKWLELQSGTRFAHPRHGEGVIKELWPRQEFYRVHYDNQNIDRTLCIYELEKLAASGTPIQILALHSSSSVNMQDSDVEVSEHTSESANSLPNGVTGKGEGDFHQVDVTNEVPESQVGNSEQIPCGVVQPSGALPDLSFDKALVNNDQTRHTQLEELIYYSPECPIEEASFEEAPNTPVDDQISTLLVSASNLSTSSDHEPVESGPPEQATDDENAKDPDAQATVVSDDGVPDLDEEPMQGEDTTDLSYTFMEVIDHFALSRNAKNIIKDNVSSFHELIELDRKKLQGFPDCGKKTLEEIIDFIQAIEPAAAENLCLRERPSGPSFDDRIIILAHEAPSEDRLHLLPIFSSRRIEYLSEHELHPGYKANANLSELPEFRRLVRMLNAMGFASLGSLLLAVESDLLEYHYFLRADLNRVRRAIRELVLRGETAQSFENPIKESVPHSSNAKHAAKMRPGGAGVSQPTRVMVKTQGSRATQLESKCVPGSSAVLGKGLGTQCPPTGLPKPCVREDSKPKCHECDGLSAMLKQMELDKVHQMPLMQFVEVISKFCRKHCDLKFSVRPYVNMSFVIRLLEQKSSPYKLNGFQVLSSQMARSQSGKPEFRVRRKTMRKYRNKSI